MAIGQPRVPADMIDMQMRAKYRVDRVGGKAGLAHVLQERALQLIPGRMPSLLVVANAGVDHDAPASGLDDEAVNRQQQAILLVSEVRLEPLMACNQVFGRGP
jgi:hypothetical protein